MVARWHSTPSGVLIITHEMFAMLGTLWSCLETGWMLPTCVPSLRRPLHRCCHAVSRKVMILIECIWCIAVPSFAAVTESKRGRPKGQRSLSASAAQLAQLEAAAAAAAAGAQQAEVPSVAEMLRDGPSVVVVDEAHVVKTETVRTD